MDILNDLANSGTIKLRNATLSLVALSNFIANNYFKFHTGLQNFIYKWVKSVSIFIFYPAKITIIYYIDQISCELFLTVFPARRRLCLRRLKSMSPDMPQARTLAFNSTKAGAFAERGDALSSLTMEARHVERSEAKSRHLLLNSVH
jgi:hypothetical protein